MTIDQFRERMATGEPITGGSDLHMQFHQYSQEALRITAEINGSYHTPEDEPLCGHAALRDSMQDLILDLVGALIVAVYGFIRHDKLIERYKQVAAS